MPQACTICRHERQAEIDQLLVAGTSLRNIAKQFGTSATALHRHKQHLAPALANAKEAAQAADAGTLLDQVKRLLGDAQRITTQAEQAKQLDVALRGIREVRAMLELLGKVSAELAAKAPGEGSDSGVREKLRALLSRRTLTQQEARDRAEALCKEYGLALVPVIDTGDPSENERRIAEILAGVGIEFPPRQPN